MVVPATTPSAPAPAAVRVQTRPPTWLGYAASAAMVAAACLAAFLADPVVDASNLSLVFVVPVVLAAVSFGWGPAVVAVLLSVAAFDFFFLEPRLTFQVAEPADLWALGLLLAVAVITSTVAAESRRRAVLAERAAIRAEALHALAQAVIHTSPATAVFELAADALGRIFAVPAVVVRVLGDHAEAAATSGQATLSPADLEAAAWSAANDKPTRAQAYPFDRSDFDFWPVRSRAGDQLVVGVKLADDTEGRPEAPDHHVALVAGYLAAAPHG